MGLEIWKFGNLELWGWTFGIVQNLEIRKSRGLRLDLWTFGNLEILKSRALGLDLWTFGHLEIWKSRALGLEIWNFGRFSLNSC